MTRFFVCALLLVTACKKASRSEGTDPGSGTAPTGSAVASGSGASAVVVDSAQPAGSGSGAGAAEAVTRPKEVAALEATLVALIDEPETDARSRKTCEMLMDIKKKMRAVAMNKPAGVDQAAWDAANAEMAGSLDALGPHCNDDPPDDSIELPRLYENFQALLALLPKSG
jgi:hypothetical protein